MGGKRKFQRYKNIFCAACGMIAVFFIFGCQYQYYPKIVIETVEGKEGLEYLVKANEHVKKKEFEKALEENKKAYNAFPPAQKQDAIVQKALIFAQPDYENKDYEKSLFCLDLLDDEEQKGLLSYTSFMIYSVLEESRRLEEKDNALKQSNKALEQSIKKYKKSIKYLRREQEKSKVYIAKLEKQIKQLKAIDLNSIDKKKVGSDE